MSVFNFRNNASTSDDNAMNLNKFVDIIGTKIPLQRSLFKICWSYLDNSNRLRVMNDFFEKESCYLIKVRNHFWREVDQLWIKCWIILVQMFTINIEHIVFNLLDILQLIHIVSCCLNIIFIQSEIHQKHFEFALDVIHIDVSSP